MTRARLKRLAVPPAYEDVLYATDPRAHIQAIGRDAAGRLQYRYHADWEKVREQRKARRLQRLVEALPRIRRAVNKHLGAAEPTREFALAAVIELVACSAIRAGSESYAKANGTRGAATLLKSNIAVQRRDGRAEIPRQGRQGDRQGIPLPARRERDQSAARDPRHGGCSSIAARTACASSRRATSTRSCARSPA